MTPKVFIACECSGTVREEFLKRGYDAWSCDLKRSPDGSNRHIVGDARDYLNDGWDLLIVAHPPCTRLCNSGVRWLNDPSKMENPGSDFTDAERAAWPAMGIEDRKVLMQKKLREGAELFSAFWNAPVPRVAIENPVMHRHAKALIENFRQHSQSVQPWQFGDWEKKRTCLWLRGLPNLEPLYPKLDIARRALGLPADAEPEARVHKMSPGEDRGAERSKFFPGIAAAMAETWGPHAMERLAA